MDEDEGDGSDSGDRLASDSDVLMEPAGWLKGSVIEIDETDNEKELGECK